MFSFSPSDLTTLPIIDDRVSLASPQKTLARKMDRFHKVESLGISKLSPDATGLIDSKISLYPESSDTVLLPLRSQPYFYVRTDTE